VDPLREAHRSRAVFHRGVFAEALVQRAQLVCERPGDGALGLERRDLAARDQGAEIVAPHEPGIDVGMRDNGGGDHAALDQRHFAEHVAVAEFGDRERAAAGQRDARLDGAAADQERAARGLALAHQLGALMYDTSRATASSCANGFCRGASEANRSSPRGKSTRDSSRYREVERVPSGERRAVEDAAFDRGEHVGAGKAARDRTLPTFSAYSVNT